MLETKALSRQEVDDIILDSRQRLDELVLKEVSYDSYTSVGKTAQHHRWKEYNGQLSEPVDTRVPVERIKELLLKANSVPDEIQTHRKIKRSGSVPCPSIK